MAQRSTHRTWLFMILFVMAAPIQVLAQVPKEGEIKAAPNPEKMLETALSKIDSGDIAEASRLFQRASRLKPTLNKLKLLEGLLYLEDKRGADALFVLDQYNKTKEGEEDYRGFAAVGRMYLETRQHPLATWQFEKAVKLAPSVENGKPVLAQITADLAMAYAGQKRMKKAIETAQKAASSAPNDGEIQLRMSEIALIANEPELVVGSIERAIAVFSGKIRDDAFNEDAHEKLIRCYEVIKSLYAYYLRTDPENGEHYHQVANVLIDQAEAERRLAALTARNLIIRAIEKDPKNTAWQLSAARLELELGGMGEAKERLEKVLQNDPENQQAIQLKQRIESRSPGPNQP
ncbi:MAG: hypothetical protein MI923_19570 [Phycisphaerales bacterium]|nr:hypothetical protein [Phycisphaerales bacterium]